MKGIIFIDIDECVSSTIDWWQQTASDDSFRMAADAETRIHAEDMAHKNPIFILFLFSSCPHSVAAPLDKFHPSVKINKNLLHRLWNVATNRNHTKHIPEFVFLSREESKKRIAKEDALCVHRLLYFFNGAANQDEVGGDVIT